MIAIEKSKAKLPYPYTQTKKSVLQDSKYLSLLHADVTQIGLRSVISEILAGSRHSLYIDGEQGDPYPSYPATDFAADSIFCFYSFQGVLESPRHLSNFLQNISPNMKPNANLVVIVMDGEEVEAYMQRKEVDKIELQDENESCQSIFSLHLSNSASDRLSWMGGDYVHFKSIAHNEHSEIMVRGLQNVNSILNQTMKKHGFELVRVVPLSLFQHMLQVEQQLYLSLTQAEREVTSLYKCVVWTRADPNVCLKVDSVPVDPFKSINLPRNDCDLLNLPLVSLMPILQFLTIRPILVLSQVSVSWMEFLACKATHVLSNNYLEHAFADHICSTIHGLKRLVDLFPPSCSHCGCVGTIGERMEQDWSCETCALLGLVNFVSWSSTDDCMFNVYVNQVLELDDETSFCNSSQCSDHEEFSVNRHECPDQKCSSRELDCDSEGNQSSGENFRNNTEWSTIVTTQMITKCLPWLLMLWVVRQSILPTTRFPSKKPGCQPSQQ